jgi:hypothetical protein
MLIDPKQDHWRFNFFSPLAASPRISHVKEQHAEA